MSVVVESFDSPESNTEQISLYTEIMAVGTIVAKPTYDKEVLLSSYCHSTNRRCIEVKANVTVGLGYSFKDEDNAKSSGVIDFNNSLYSKDGSPKPFSKLLKDWLVDKGIFGESRLELCRIGGKVENMLVLSSKNVFLSTNRKDIWQFDKRKGKAIQFGRYGYYSKKIHDTLLISDNSPEDDYYGVPCYVSALTSIDTDKKMKYANNKSLDNIIDPSMVMVVTGYPVTKDEIDNVRDSLNEVKSKRSSSILLNFGNKDANVDINNFGVKTIDGNYKEDMVAISLEVLALHGMTPEIYGILSNGGISSGEKATGALKIFFQTTVRPEQEAIERLLNEFYRTEFPNFSKDNGIVFNTIDLTDYEEDSKSELTDVQIVKEYVAIGSLDAYNEYRQSKGLALLDESKWENMVKNRTNTGVKLGDIITYK